MKHEAIHALAAHIRSKVETHDCPQGVDYCDFPALLRLDLADELDTIAEAHHAEAVYRNETMFA